MVTLNLDTAGGAFPLPTGGTFVHGMSDLEFLQCEIADWLTSPQLADQLDSERYYDGKHDILDRRITMVDEAGKEVEIPYLPNNKIVDNQYAKCVDQKTNYLMGKPFVFDCSDKKHEKVLETVFDSGLRQKLKTAAREAVIGGKAWIMPYYGEGGKLEFSVLSASSVRPFWADAAHTKLDCAIHLYRIEEYTQERKKQITTKVEVLHGGGIDRFVYREGALVRDPDAPSGAYITADGKPYNWKRIPLVCFKYSEAEQPLLNKVRGLQDQLNLKTSDFMNALDATVYNSVIVLENYDGEDTESVRKNIMSSGVIKVRTFDGVKGDARILKLDVDSDSYKKAIDHLKQSIIDNARGHDAKDDRLGNSPNQMNIQSMYSDMDLDANGMETEFKAAMQDLLWFINQDLANRGFGNYTDCSVDVIFNRDILVNESEAIKNCSQSVGMISDETLLKNHPYVNNPAAELERIKKEKAEAADVYGSAFSSVPVTVPKGNE